jgi:hypothetical protein
MLVAFPVAMRKKVLATGVHTGEWDPQALLELAPWYPIPATGAEEEAVRQQWGFGKCGALRVGEPLDGDACVGGYVIMTYFKADKVKFVIEDETGIVSCRVANGRVASIGSLFRDFKIGDYVAVQGWWQGETLYVKNGALIKRREKK